MGIVVRHGLILICLFAAFTGYAQNMRVTSLTVGSGGVSNAVLHGPTNRPPVGTNYTFWDENNGYLRFLSSYPGGNPSTGFDAPYPIFRVRRAGTPNQILYLAGGGDGTTEDGFDAIGMHVKGSDDGNTDGRFVMGFTTGGAELAGYRFREKSLHIIQGLNGGSAHIWDISDGVNLRLGSNTAPLALAGRSITVESNLTVNFLGEGRPAQTFKHWNGNALTTNVDSMTYRNFDNGNGTSNEIVALFSENLEAGASLRDSTKPGWGAMREGSYFTGGEYQYEFYNRYVSTNNGVDLRLGPSLTFQRDGGYTQAWLGGLSYVHVLNQYANFNPSGATADDGAIFNFWGNIDVYRNDSGYTPAVTLFNKGLVWWKNHAATASVYAHMGQDTFSPGTDSTALEFFPLDGATGVQFHTAVATAATAVSLTADNQTVICTNRSYIQLSSDNGTAGNRTFVLTPSVAVMKGQIITLEWTGTNAGELVDDAAMTGSGNVRLSATWTPTQYDTLTLRFNGTDLVEQARSTN